MGKPTLANPGVSTAEFIGGEKTTQGSEPSQYLQEQKTIVIPLVAASERGRAQTVVHARRGCKGRLASKPGGEQPVGIAKEFGTSAHKRGSPASHTTTR